MTVTRMYRTGLDVWFSVQKGICRNGRHDILMSALSVYQGPRSEKITILMPKALVEDLRALRLATGQSTGDLVNQLLEAHLSTIPEDLEAGRIMMAARTDRARRKELREGVPNAGIDKAAEGPKASGGPGKEGAPAVSGGATSERSPAPDDAFIDGVAMGEGIPAGDRSRIRTQAREFREWCERHDARFTDREALEVFLEGKYPDKKPDTMGKNRRMVKHVIEAWEDRE